MIFYLRYNRVIARFKRLDDAVDGRRFGGKEEERKKKLMPARERGRDGARKQGGNLRRDKG